MALLRKSFQVSELAQDTQWQCELHTLLLAKHWQYLRQERRVYGKICP